MKHLALLTIFASLPLVAAEDAPAWLRAAASALAPKYAATVPAVVLFDEGQIFIDDSGRRTVVTRRAIRILSREGRHYARGAEPYYTGTGKVKDLHAWMILPSGEVKRFGKDRIVDVAMSPDDVYNEGRVRVVAAENEADPGAVFGFEAVSEDKSIFTQNEWRFQEKLPVLSSRFTLNLPSGWRAEGVTFNTAAITPAVSGSGYSWEMHNLPPIEDEPASPEVSALAPRLAVSFFPPGVVKNAGPSFASWEDVSRFQTELSDPQQVTSPPMIEKTQSLIAGAKTELDKISAIGRHVQSVHYISIQVGVGRGGGYRPHSAADVFAKSYGDCKDKANLMRTMLKVAGIPSYLVAIYSGDRTFVREQWPSPMQFNHMIVAVKVSDQTQAPAVLNHPSLGRLLIFDPTDEITPVGYLPEYEQDSLALLLAGEQGGLARMPVTPPSQNRIERETAVTLTEGGDIQASLHERRAGESAADARRILVHRARSEYVKRIEAWISRGVTGAAVSKVEPQEGLPETEFGLNVDFNAQRYGRLMQNRLLIFRPALVASQDSLIFPQQQRKYPVVLDSESFTETVRVRLPAGFDVDEIPNAADMKTAFGSYHAKWTAENGTLLFTRSLEVKAATIPVDRYSDVRAFFNRVSNSEQASVVLVRK